MMRIRKSVGILALCIVLLCLFSIELTTYAAVENNGVISEVEITEPNQVIRIPFNDEMELVLEVDLVESRSGQYVYANAHGTFFYSGTPTKNISQYGMNVTFEIDNNSSNVGKGENITLYHNCSDDNYEAVKEASFSGEDTGNCSATGTFTLIQSKKKMYDASITLRLEITSEGKKTMYCSGSYGQWNVDWGN